jgi:hypothetical protein
VRPWGKNFFILAPFDRKIKNAALHMARDMTPVGGASSPGQVVRMCFPEDKMDRRKTGTRVGFRAGTDTLMVRLGRELGARFAVRVLQFL